MKTLYSSALTHSTRLLSGLCLSGLLSLGLTNPVRAAERVTLTFGFAEVSTPVEDLRAYAERGEVSRELKFYLNLLSAEQQLQFRQALQARQNVGPARLSKFLRSSIGDNILRYLGTVVQTAGRRDGKIGLRGALVLSAAEPEGLSLLGVLEKFPTGTVRIDSLRGLQIVSGLTAQLEDTAAAIAAIKTQSAFLPPDPLDIPFKNYAEPDTSGYGEFTVETRDFYDEGRDRTITTDLYVPVEATIAAPVIIISHGLSGDRDGLAELAEHLANQGFAVAAIEHPASNRAQLENLLGGVAREIAEPSEFVDRPKDVSFVIDELTRLDRLARSNSDRLGIEIDLDKVGVIGHSFGGYTALALAGAQLNYDTLFDNCESEAFVFNAANPSMLLQCTALNAPEQFDMTLEDDRVLAVMALNPIGSSLFGQTGFAQIDIPVFMVAGSSDPVAPALLEQIQPFTWMKHLPPVQPDPEDNSSNVVVPYPQHYLALIEGGSHLYDLPTLNDVDVSPANRLISAEPELAYTYLKHLSIAFFKPEVAESKAYRRGLAPDNLRQLSQPDLPLYVVDALTGKMLMPPKTTNTTPGVDPALIGPGAPVPIEAPATEDNTMETSPNSD